MHWMVHAEQHHSADGTKFFFAGQIISDAGVLVVQTCTWRLGQPMVEQRERVEGEPRVAHARATERVFAIRDVWLADLRQRDGVG